MSTTYYTSDHEWLAIDDNIATVGITDHAQQALGEIVFVDLPELEQNCQKGEVVAVVESVKAASDVYAPISGEVVEINTDLDESPEIVNDAAESDGWFMKVRLDETFDTSEYMNHETYLNSLND
ncbi:MAG: glycine cleavage system protein GcvH [Cellvibrionaceae bacterium]